MLFAVLAVVVVESCISHAARGAGVKNEEDQFRILQLFLFFAVAWELLSKRCGGEEQLLLC
jgi:hypothetical protein